MRRAWILIAIAACGDSASTVDEVCVLDRVDLSCEGSIAVGETLYDRSTSRTLACAEHEDRVLQVTCTNGGCAVQVPITTPTGPDTAVLADPSILCAATAEAKIGDPCTRGCLPTRAQLAADGTVTGQTYLACDPSSHCVAVAPPVVAGYLQACDAQTIATYGTAGATGYVVAGARACLIAWDASANAPRSGVTATCVGDWDCPAGALCDDRLHALGGMPDAVCKPGPRGALTAAMLSP